MTAYILIIAFTRLFKEPSLSCSVDQYFNDGLDILVFTVLNAAEHRHVDQ